MEVDHIDHYAQIAKGARACQEEPLSKLFQWCFPSTQLEQIPPL